MFKKINPFLKNNKSFSENTKVIDFLCKSYIIVLMKNTKKHKIKKYMTYILLIVIIITMFSGCSAQYQTISDTQFILDTVCTITAGGVKNTKELISGAFDVVYKIQSNISYYDSGSTVSIFNSSPAGVPAALDPDTYTIVEKALEVSKASNGAFDITIAPVEELWDFKSESPVPPEQNLINENLKYVGYNNLILDSENKTLTKTIDGVKIDLGGCGKGYACQKALEYIEENYPDSYAILDFGGNVNVYGQNPKKINGSFTVGIQEPFAANGSYSEMVDITSGESIVTSGTYQRHFYYNNKNYHHILDPSTGTPSDRGFDSVSVISSSSLEADCLSTACLVLGETDGTKLANKFNAKTYWIKQRSN